MSLSETEIQAVSDDYWEKETTDIYFEDNVALWMLTKGLSEFSDTIATPGEMVDNGKKIRVPLEYAKANTGGYGNRTEIPLTKVEILNAALFDWGGAFAANSIDLDDQIKNPGDAHMINLIMHKIDNIRKSLRDQMGRDVYYKTTENQANAGGESGDYISGLGDLFNTTTSTAYANIAEDDMAAWKANVITSAGDVGLALMQQIRRTAAVGQTTAKKPNIYIMRDAIKDIFTQKAQAQQRLTDPKLAAVGFPNILFEGVPCVADDRIPAGHIEGLNLRFLSLKTHPKYAFTKPVWEHPLGQPDVKAANSRWIGQLVCSNRKAHCRATGVNES